MTFLDPLQTLRDMDDLEGYVPGKPSLYHRALVAAETEDGVWSAAWSYTAPNLPESDWTLHPANVW
jgi:hypothetical protein